MKPRYFLPPLIMSNKDRVRTCYETGKKIQVGELCMFIKPNRFYHETSRKFTETEI